MRYKTKREAAEAWVREFNAFPTEMIRELMDNSPECWHEVTVVDEEDCFDGYLPMWGTMWQFDDWADNGWFEFEDGIQAMSKCGFRVYEHEDYGYFFGIEGAGYNFYEAHWIPLYQARGLHWHEEEEIA